MPTKYAYVETISATPFSADPVIYYHLMPSFASRMTGTTVVSQDEFIQVLMEARKNVKVVADRLPFGVRSVDEITYEESIGPTIAQVRRTTWKKFYNEFLGIR